MGVEGGVPLGVAEEGVKFANGGICPLIAPGETPVL